MTDSAATASVPRPRESPRALPWRGLVEGFYGEPWSLAERTTYFRFAAENGLDRYVYAPKFDPYHREQWRTPYPRDELESLARLVAAADEAGVSFVYAISPGLSMRYADEAEHAALRAKAAQLWDVGVRSFSLLFDDVPMELTDAGDLARFGDGPDGAGRAHGRTAARFREEFLRERGVHEPLLVCPTDYAGTGRSPYRDGLAETLPGDSPVFWTGSDIVVGTVSRADIDAAADSFGRDLVLWDNFPVNDFDRSRLFLGPLSGRTTDVEGSRLVGLAVNPMVEAAPSRFALSACAEWAADPSAYREDDAADRSRARVAGAAVTTLAPLLDACSSWPPSAPPAPALDRLIDGAVAGDRGAIASCRDWMDRLAATSAEGAPEDLRAALAPWVRAARDVGAAGSAACALLAERAEVPLDAEALESLRSTWTRAETHYANVLRSPVRRLVAAALEHHGDDGPPAPDAPGGAARILVLTARNPAPGDRELAEFLHAEGHAVTVRHEAADLDGVDLVIVTGTADEHAVATVRDLPRPVLAWGHLVALGLAVESDVASSVESVEVASTHPIAAGLEGPVRTFRGPSRLTWGTPVAGARVIATTPTDGKPVLVLYESGAALVRDRPAPAARVAFFLGAEGFAPWLVTDATRQIMRAAVWFLAEDARDDAEQRRDGAGS
jgi:hypothetical protein